MASGVHATIDDALDRRALGSEKTDIDGSRRVSLHEAKARIESSVTPLQEVLLQVARCSNANPASKYDDETRFLMRERIQELELYGARPIKALTPGLKPGLRRLR
jgi:hypothetical protein